MIRKVIGAKVGSSITRYDDLWLLQLECGHTMRTRRASSKNKPPTKKNCLECDKPQPQPPDVARGEEGEE